MKHASLALLVTAALTSACVSDAAGPATQLVLIVDSELDTPSEIDRVTIRVSNPPSEPFEQSASVVDLGAPRWPLTLGVVRRDAASSEVTVTVTGAGSDGANTVVAMARTSFVPHETRILPLVLRAPCRGVVCASALESCAPSGTCGDAAVVGTDLVTGDAIAQVAGGFAWTCARLATGSVRCWGSPDASIVYTTPTTVPTLDDVDEIAVAESHACARRRDGTVACWGANPRFEVGDTDTTFHTTPTVVHGVNDAVRLAVGYDHSCALSSDSVVRCWGDDDAGQLGPQTQSMSALPVVVPVPGTVVEIACGDGSSCARTDGGRVYCWGRGTDGQLGDGRMVDSSTPVAVSALTDAVQITARYRSVCARRADGSVVCWGRNDSGQLGDGTTTARSAPTGVLATGGAPLIHAVDVLALVNSSCARTQDGGVMCWGANGSDQLGDGSPGHAMASTVLARDGSSLRRVVALGGGHFHVCVRDESSAVLCWGANGSGQASIGSSVGTIARPTPVGVTP